MSRRYGWAVIVTAAVVPAAAVLWGCSTLDDFGQAAVRTVGGGDGAKETKVFEVKRTLSEKGLSGQAALDFLNPHDKGTIGDIADMSGFELLTLRGEGVVVGLQGTGDMSEGVLSKRLRRLAAKRLMQVRDPYFTGDSDEVLSPKVATRWMNSGYVSMVVLETVISIGQHKDERVDVAFRAIDGATSLEGGYLFAAPLRPISNLGEKRGTEQGRVLVEASGPVTVNASGREGGAGELTVGLVESGGRLLLEYSQFILRLAKPNPRRALYMEGYLNTRFAGLDKVAVAQQNGIIVVTIPDSYWADPMRFVEVIRFMPASDPGESAKSSLASQAAGLLRSGDARQRIQGAIRLEGLGAPQGPEALKTALVRGSVLSRIEAGRSLYFLGDEEARNMADELLSEPSPEERLEALKLYMLFGSRAPLDKIRRLLRDRDPLLAAAAAFVVDYCGGSVTEALPGGGDEVIDIRLSPQESGPFQTTTRAAETYRVLSVPGASVEGVVAVVGDDRRAIVVLGAAAIEGNFSVQQQRLALSMGATGDIEVSFRARDEKGKFQVDATAAKVVTLLDFMGLPWSENVFILMEIYRKNALKAPVKTLPFTGSKTATRLMKTVLSDR